MNSLNDKQNTSVPESSNQLVFPKKANKLAKYLIIFVGIFSMLLIAVFIYLYLSNVRTSQNNQITIAEPFLTPKPINLLETKETKIAGSLEIPQLYPQGQWEDVIEKTNSNGLNEVPVFLEDNSNKMIPFVRGKYWKSKSPIEYYQVEAYYWNDVKNKGWVGLSDKGYIQFSHFQLYGGAADGACGGQQGYLGYKDNMVRLISIRRKLTPCYSPPNIAPSLAPNGKIFGDYNIFISDPTPIEEIASFIK